MNTLRRPLSSMRAFTLVELLVTIGILVLLIAILLPSVIKARQNANSVQCRAQLHDIGKQFQMYLNESNYRVPRLQSVPSNGIPAGAPSLVQLLEPYNNGAQEVFECPADYLSEGAGGGFTTYYEREGLSYEYNSFFNAFLATASTGSNASWQSALGDAQKHRGSTPDQLRVVYDFGPFHDEAGSLSSRNVLYADFHVNDFDNE